jgi:hypothetical protein
MGSYLRVGLTVGALALGLALAGCESFDPTDIFDSEIFNTKKKLPGERQPVFPDGTPGVARGVPPELVKGYQAPAESQEATAKPAEAKPATKEATAKPVETKPATKEATADPAEAKPKPKPKPKVVAKPAEAAATGTVRAPQPSAQASQWPDPPPTQGAPAASAWPSAPSGGVAWPDPPASR